MVQGRNARLVAMDCKRSQRSGAGSLDFVVPKIQGNEVYGGGETSAGLFLHRSSDDAIIKSEHIVPPICRRILDAFMM